MEKLKNDANLREPHCCISWEFAPKLFDSLGITDEPVQKVEIIIADCLSPVIIKVQYAAHRKTGEILSDIADQCKEYCLVEKAYQDH